MESSTPLEPGVREATFELWVEAALSFAPAPSWVGGAMLPMLTALEPQVSDTITIDFRQRLEGELPPLPCRQPKRLANCCIVGGYAHPNGVEPRVARSPAEVASRSPVGRQVASRSRQQVASGRQWSPVGCQQKSPVPQLVRWRPPVASWSPGRQCGRQVARSPVENHTSETTHPTTQNWYLFTYHHPGCVLQPLGLDVFYFPTKAFMV